MIYSMTGFGQVKGNYKGKTIKVEVKSLNGKTTDLRLKLPTSYKSKEISIRNQILDSAVRGKVDANISIESALGDEIYSLRADLFKQYYSELKSVSDDLDLKNGDILQSIMRIQGVLYQKEVELEEEEWRAVQKIIDDALEQFNHFRKQEGDAMHRDLIVNLNNIRTSLSSIDKYEQSRVVKLKERLKKNLEQFVQDEGVDKNRFEQEVLYYIEKLDINEEKMRLAQHCNYFEEVLNSSTLSKGKKLAFVSQEMGREINTLGAKAQEHNIQQIVVNMKDDLEKIKEMMANVLSPKDIPEFEPKLLVFTAPSGAGKTTIVKYLLNTYPFLGFSISATNRDKRPKEVDGRDYYFLSTESFHEKVKNQDFIEWEEVYDNQFYGTLKSEVERNWDNKKYVVFDIEVKGATNIKKLYGDKALVVFIRPPSLNTLIQRLTDRNTESPASLRKRISRVKKEMQYENTFDYVLVNDVLEVSLKEAEIITESFILGKLSS